VNSNNQISTSGFTYDRRVAQALSGLEVAGAPLLAVFERWEALFFWL
jgi:hypothetical protein